MDAFLTTYPSKKNSCRMFEGEKNILQEHTPRKKIDLNEGVEKKFMHIPNQPPPPPIKLNGWPGLEANFSAC